MDLTIKGKAFVNETFQDLCIGIKDGKIAGIKKILNGEEHIDFGNKLILPAGVDIHVHFRDPGMTQKEDFSTGSMAAAFGGVSCVFDMPNTIPQTTTLPALSDKIISFGKKSYVDFGVYAGITNDNLGSIGSLAKRCSGFKIYLGSTTNSLKFDKKIFRAALESVSKTNKVVLFHAEDEELLSKNKGKETNIVDHLRFRPSICEETSIKDIIRASQGLNVKSHICHVSSIEGLEILKNRQKNISFGITPHHSLLRTEKISGHQTFYKVNPPIRTNFDKEALFNALKNGVADVLESDHAPHTKDEKDVDFDDAPSGLPGVETMYPLFLYMAKKDTISYKNLISLMCKRPAELLNISKGTIEVGKDADFIIVDIKKESRIKSDKLHSKCGWTPFEDWHAIFPSHVFLRGEKLIDDREMQVKQGFGIFVGR